GERHRMAALLGYAPHLLGHQVGIPNRRQCKRNHAPGVSTTPLVDVPVVVGAQHRQTEVLVLSAGEVLTAELRVGREVHRGDDAVGVHVADPFVDVVAALADFAEFGWLGAVLVRWAARDGVEPDVGGFLTLEYPGVGPVGPLDQLRYVVFVLVGDVTLEHVGRFHKVVVHGNQDEVVHFHRDTPCASDDRDSTVEQIFGQQRR